MPVTSNPLVTGRSLMSTLFLAGLKAIGVTPPNPVADANELVLHGGVLANMVVANAAATLLALFAGGTPGIWLDPSDFSTMFQDSAGTTPVTAVGQPVGLMLDKSGNGNSVSQPTATARPLLAIDANGKYFLQFDGIDDCLYSASAMFSAGPAMAVAVGATQQAGGGSSAYGPVMELSINSDNAAGSFLLFINTNTGISSISSDGTNKKANVSIPATAVGKSFELISYYDFSAVTQAAQITGNYNGTDIGGYSSALQAGNFSPYPLYIGRRAAAGSQARTNLYQGIIVGRPLSTAEKATLQQYLHGKTGAY